MTLAPVREAADSLQKATTPEPWSASKTSNWIARLGGLPPYVQHISHDLLEKGRAVSESNAIQMAVGIVKNPPKNWGDTARQAAAKAASQWEALKGKAKKLGVNHPALQHSYVPCFADELALREAAIARIVVLEDAFGSAGLLALAGLQEAKGESFSPSMKRVPAARGEMERLDLHHEGQHVGTISRRRYESVKGSMGDRWRAHAINGEAVAGEYDNPLKSKDEAIKAVETHLSEAPARVVSLPDAGKYLVAKPSTYGATTYTEFPNEQAARHAAGLPPQPTLPERNSQVENLGEMLALDLAVIEGLDLPPLRRVQEARRRVPFG